jgi:2-polyprenyl-6-methoxyphenol hydroxylase-like FAD-dependent oxidoreductase
MLLGRAGLKVLVVDPLPRGRDALSTHALMRGGVMQLHRWGLLEVIRRAGTPPLPVTTFDYGDEVVSIPIKAKDGVDALFAPRRTVLDPILAEAAEAAGADVVHGLSVTDLLRDPEGRVRGAWVTGADGTSEPVSADLVIGADGAHSRVARLVDAPVEGTGAHATASIFGYWQGLPQDETRWYFRPGLSMGTIPTNDGAACIFVTLPSKAFGAARAAGLDSTFHRLVRDMDPAVAEVVSSTAPAGSLRAFAGMKGFLKTPVGPGWALVGDAGYFRDPLTAHGISDALRDAELLARAVGYGADAAAGAGGIPRGDSAMAAYHRTRNLAAQGVMEVTDRIAGMAWSMEEVKAMHQTLSREMNVGVEVIREMDLSPLPAA